MSRISNLSRVDRDFKKEVDAINLGRKNAGRPCKPFSRITLAIKRHSLFPTIKNDIINSDLSKSKRGAVTDMFLLIIIGFTIIILSALFIYGFGQITSTLTTASSPSNINISDAAQKTFGQIDIGIQQLRWWTFAIILGLALSIFISSFLVRTHPVFFVFYVLIVIMAIVVSIIISNSYEDLMTSGTILGDQLNTFVGSSYLMLHLPIWITLLGMAGGIVLFIGIMRDSGQGGGLV